MLLSDVFVLDASDRFGWLAGRVLADLGAEVTKLDPPGTDHTEPDWRALNVNKRPLALDLAQTADRLQLEELLRAADICLVTPATFDAGCRLDPDRLRRIHPRLV